MEEIKKKAESLAMKVKTQPKPNSDMNNILEGYENIVQISSIILEQTIALNDIYESEKKDKSKQEIPEIIISRSKFKLEFWKYLEK